MLKEDLKGLNNYLDESKTEEIIENVLKEINNTKYSNIYMDTYYITKSTIDLLKILNFLNFENFYFIITNKGDYGKYILNKLSKIPRKNEKDNQVVLENIERISIIMEKETINPLKFLLFKIDPYIEFTNNISFLEKENFFIEDENETPKELDIEEEIINEIVEEIIDEPEENNELPFSLDYRKELKPFFGQELSIFCTLRQISRVKEQKRYKLYLTNIQNNKLKIDHLNYFISEKDFKKLNITCGDKFFISGKVIEYTKGNKTKGLSKDLKIEVSTIIKYNDISNKIKLS